MIKMILQFAVVGLAGVGVNMAVYLYMTSMGVNYLTAAVCSFILAVTNNFVWNVLWTFRGRAKGGSMQKKYLSFFVISVVNFGVNLFVLQLLVVYFRVGAILAQVLAIAFVSGLNFVLNYCITFGERLEKREEAVYAKDTGYHTNL